MAFRKSTSVSRSSSCDWLSVELSFSAGMKLKPSRPKSAPSADFLGLPTSRFSTLSEQDLHQRLLFGDGRADVDLDRAVVEVPAEGLELSYESNHQTATELGGLPTATRTPAGRLHVDRLELIETSGSNRLPVRQCAGRHGGIR
jgi:hypothetical protein